jgi:hypothetical protein
MEPCAKCGGNSEVSESGTMLCFICSERIDAARKETARAQLQSAGVDVLQVTSPDF